MLRRCLRVRLRCQSLRWHGNRTRLGNADESTRSGNSVRKGQGRSGHPFEPESAADRVLPRDPVRVPLGRRAPVHAPDEHDGKVGRNQGRPQVSPRLPSATPFGGRTGMDNAKVTGGALPQALSVSRKATGGLSQPQHLRAPQR